MPSHRNALHGLASVGAVAAGVLAQGERRAVKKHVILHPFLFAIFPALFLYLHNIGELWLAQLAAPLAIVTASSLILWLLLRLILRDQIRAAVLSSLWWVWFFSWGYVRPLGRVLVFASTGESDRAPVFLAIYFILLLCLAGLALTRRRGLGTLSSALNVAAVALVGWQVVAIANCEVGRARAHRSMRRRASIAAPRARPARALPNIYYIILDGYARADVLKDLYQYDNSEFLAYLARRGFSVARRGRANYCQTLLSLASSLNLEYLDELAKPLRSSSDRNSLMTMIQDNRLCKFLRERGYRVIAFPSGFGGTELRRADMFVEGAAGLNEFQSALLDTTPVPLLVRQRSAEMLMDPLSSGARIHYAFDHLPETAKLTPPVLVFAHIVCPHPPFVFDGEGHELPSQRPFPLGDGSHFSGTREEYVAAYREQLIFVNREVETTIAAILGQSKWPTVIILQSDHGPGSRLDWKSAARTDQRERLGALIAVRLPEGQRAEIDDDLSPVNIFRILLSRYFDAKLDVLPNECFYSTWERPYDFTRVTDKVEPEMVDSLR